MTLSWRPSISADGRFVAFESYASNLVPEDTNGVEDVFVHDRETGETTRASVDSSGGQADRVSMFARLSADGRYVAFMTNAALVWNDTNITTDIYVHDRETGQTTRASVDSNGLEGNATSNTPTISGNGRFVTFWSGS
jgi:Tol biopolymer transport system component